MSHLFARVKLYFCDSATSYRSLILQAFIETHKKYAWNFCIWLKIHKNKKKMMYCFLWEFVTKNILIISQLWCFFWRLQARVLIFNRFACFWPKGYHLGSLGKSHQNGDYLKEAMRKSCLPTGFEPAAFGLPVHCSTSWARKDVSSHA